MQDKYITDLQTQIESIHNTRDFEQLVNDLFVRIYGMDYVTSDYHQDGGMDGYIRPSKTLVAKHCFEKLVPRSRDSEILKKAKDDLKKAVELSKRLEIRRWMFITPYLKPTNAYVTLKKEVEAAGFQFDWLDSSFITDVLTTNKDIIQNHPKLHTPQIEETLQDIKKSLNVLVTEAQIDKASKAVEKSPKPALERVISAEQPKLLPNVFKTAPKKEESKDFKRVLEIYKSTPNTELEKEIKSIIYSSSDQAAVLQGVHLLVSWYKFSRDTVDDFMAFVNLGIDTSKVLKNLDSEAILLAEKASLLSTKFVLMDLEGWGEIEMSNITGLPLITDEKRSAIVSELKRLNKEFNELSKDAMQKSYASNNYLAVTRTFSIVGSSAGNRAGHFLSLGIKERATLELGVCKGTFMYAKNIAAQFKDEPEIAYILYNFANALGFVGETDEALLVLKEAVNIAKKYKMNDILGNIERLEKLIKEPKIRLVNHE